MHFFLMWQDYRTNFRVVNPDVVIGERLLCCSLKSIRGQVNPPGNENKLLEESPLIS